MTGGMQLGNRRLLASLFAVSLVLAACRTPAPLPPPPPVVAPPAPVVVVPAPEPELSPGVSVSPPQTGDESVAFAQSRGGERTFPNNQIGANLTFTSNLRMPKLEAVPAGKDGFQLRMRFSNKGKEPLVVAVTCVYEEAGGRATRGVRRLEFPVNSFRDIAIDLPGDVSRKVTIRASAAPSAVAR